MVQWEFLVLRFFFLVPFAVFGLKLSIVLGKKDKEIVPIFILMKLGMLQEFIELHQITKIETHPLDEDQKRDLYGACL